MHDPDLSHHPTPFELTSLNHPAGIRRPEYVKENAEWVARLARRIVQVRRD
jgi:hypothetical protein